MAHSVLSAQESRRMLAVARATVLAIVLGSVLLPNVAVPLTATFKQDTPNA